MLFFEGKIIYNYHKTIISLPFFNFNSFRFIFMIFIQFYIKF